jgi:DNA-binding NtrC family response regulator
MKFTDLEIDRITEFLRRGEQLPKEFKERILFQSDDHTTEEGPIHESGYSGMTLYKAREKLEKDLILRALSENGNIIRKTAADLGISRPTLYVFMEKLKIPKPKPDAKIYGK